MARTESRATHALLAALTGSVLASTVGGIGSRHARTVYGQLARPRWAPPPQVFAPVWTGLYGLMAAAVFRAWRADPRRSSGLIALHVVQLALNAAWPWAFFSVRSRTASLVVVGALDGAVAAEVIVASRRDRPAGALLAPYLAWSLFATALTAAVGDPANV